MLRPIDLDQLYTELVGRGLSSRTVRICHTVMRQSLEQARKWGLIARSPAVDASPPPQRHKEVNPPTVTQVLELLAAAQNEDTDFATYLRVLVATGCRRGEACALRWSDVDFDRAEVAPAARSLRSDARFAKRTPRPTSPAGWRWTKPHSSSCASTADASSSWR